MINGIITYKNLSECGILREATNSLFGLFRDYGRSVVWPFQATGPDEEPSALLASSAVVADGLGELRENLLFYLRQSD